MYGLNKEKKQRKQKRKMKRKGHKNGLLNNKGGTIQIHSDAHSSTFCKHNRIPSNYDNMEIDGFHYQN